MTTFNEKNAADRVSNRFYVLATLTFVSLFSYMDRQILSILIEDIGAEFAMNDTQRGFLMGLAFALFYAGLGIPVAWLADRANRKNIISTAITVWSFATALCAFATGFWTLFLARVGVAVGESGGGPPAQSIITDHFEKHELARAFSVYSLGTTFGAVIGLVLGGVIADMFNWRVAFFAFGIPGILLGSLIFFTIREPRRGRLDPSFESTNSPTGFKRSISRLLRNRAYAGNLVAHTLQTFSGYVIISWTAAIFIRQFGLSKTEVGVFFGLAILLGSFPGMLAGGLITDKLALRDQRYLAWVPAMALLVCAPIQIATPFMPTPLFMALSFGVGGFCYSMAFAPSFAIVQTYVRPDERALGAAIVGFMGNLIGLGAGPTVAGILSDNLNSVVGDMSLNYAVSITQVFMIPAGLVFLWTAHQLKRPRVPYKQGVEINA